MTMEMADVFDAYVRCGMRPIPLYPNTKIPMNRDWQTGWSADRYRDFFIITPNCNIGLLLGEIIDVEGDSEFANDQIKDLVRGVPHPMFKSSKSVHHLFISPDPTLTICKVGDIEFRGCRHQSVIPPSKHESGANYAWLKGSTFPAPPIPTRLWEFMMENRKKIKRVKPPLTSTGKKANHVQTTCNKCKRKEYLHKKRLVLEVRAFRAMKLLWQCHKCRAVDVRPICRELRDQAKAQAS